MVEVEPVLSDKSIVFRDKSNGNIVLELSLEDLADILEFRYAMPWNKSKETMERAAIVIADVLYMVGNVEGEVDKDLLIDMVKKRKYF
ncbi:hypothetical protein A3L09_06935 [Thermococcus profundus]|uniref:Uncharacterized protein n=1 Tax=Thermococcus profundus TaxID=49899 RepID=A0A2Z2MM70_THEPR|nr:hypothetical protein [Thermococcus profundus]ASJ03008.1 hypothetical protein A3L09_06935 [Thermococcus profundus]